MFAYYCSVTFCDLLGHLDQSDLWKSTQFDRHAALFWSG